MYAFKSWLASVGRGVELIVAVGMIAILAGGGSTFAAAIPVVLNFDSGGPNSFQSALDSAAATAGLTGAGTYFNGVGTVAIIENEIQTEITAVYSGLNITFTTTLNAAQRSATFGDAAPGDLFGQAPYNWRNGFLANTPVSGENESNMKAQIYPQEFDAVLSNANTLGQNETNIAIAIADTTAHELGHTFGLDHQDDYGDPGITPANYGNTGGIQNTHIMATTPTGLAVASRSIPRRFGQLELAKLAQSNNVYVAGGFTPNLIPDSSVAHTQRSTVGANAAQPINFQYIPIAGESAVTVRNGSIGGVTDDVYSFSGMAGQLLTADIIARTNPTPEVGNPGSTFFSSPARCQLSLWQDDGGSPVLVGAISVDKEYSGNNWLGSPNVDADPMILNQPLPANDTYYLDVLSIAPVGTGLYNYEMFVAVPEPATFVLAALGLAVLGIGGCRRSRSAVKRSTTLLRRRLLEPTQKQLPWQFKSSIGGGYRPNR